MHNILIIAKREYLERVRSRSFVIMTFLTPALLIGATAIPTMMANRGSNEIKSMVIVAPERETADLIRTSIEQQQDQPASKPAAPAARTRSLPPLHYKIEVSTNATQAERDTLTEKVKQKQLDAFLWATPEAIAGKKIDLVTLETSNLIG